MSMSLEIQISNQTNVYGHMTMMGIYPALCIPPSPQPSACATITESLKKEESKATEISHMESTKLKNLIPRINLAKKLMMTSYQIFARRKRIYYGLLEEYKQTDLNLAMKDGRYKKTKPRAPQNKKELTLSSLTPEQIEELKQSLLKDL